MFTTSFFTRSNNHEIPTGTVSKFGSTFELLSILSLILTIAFFIDRFKRRRFFKLINELPSPKKSFARTLVDFFLDMIRTFDSGKTFFDMQHRYAKMFEKEGLFTISFEPIASNMVVITSPKAYKDVLMDQENTFKNFTYNLLHDLIGVRNLIASGGMEWKHDRKIVDPSFKYSILMSMNGSISKRVDLLISEIKKRGNKVNDMHRLLAPVITHVILESAIGFEIDPKDPKLHDYVAGQRKFTDALIIRIIFPLFYVFPPLFNWTLGLPVQMALKRIKKFISDAVDRRMKLLAREDAMGRKSGGVSRRMFKKEVESNEKGEELTEEERKPSLSDTLIKAHLSDPKIIPKDVIIDQVTTFVFVGHKATSITLNAILFLLASHPEKQKKLQAELDSIFNEPEDSGFIEPEEGFIEPEDGFSESGDSGSLNSQTGDSINSKLESDLLNVDKLNKCIYLNAVIKEGQRMYPISASIGRRVTKELKVAGYDIPVGAEIVFDFNSLTKHPHSFPFKPNQFIPERFIPGEETFDPHRDNFSLIPFSHGLRKCIGEKFAINILKVFLIKLLLRYDLKTKQTPQSITLVQDIMVYFRTPIDLEFTERNIHKIAEE